MHVVYSNSQFWCFDCCGCDGEIAMSERGRFENYSEAKESELSKKNNLLNELRGSAVFIEQTINIFTAGKSQVLKMTGFIVLPSTEGGGAL